MFVYLQLKAKRGDLSEEIRINSKLLNFYPSTEQQQYIDKRSDELMADYENEEVKWDYRLLIIGQWSRKNVIMSY